MHHDQENDRIINEDASLKIYPLQVYWNKSHSIEIDYGSDFSEIPVSEIDNLIAGLKMAKELINT